MAKGKFGKLVALSALAGAGAWIYKKYDTIKSMYHKVSLFKGERYEYDTFDGEAIAAMFSGVMIDLSDVEFTDDEVYLDIYALCSGVKVLIPRDVEVVLEGTNNASGITVDQDEDSSKLKTLYINYNITASGLLVTDNIDECDCGDDCTCDDDDEEYSSSEDDADQVEESDKDAIFGEADQVNLEDSHEVTNDFEEASKSANDYEETPAVEETSAVKETPAVEETQEQLDETVNQAAEELNDAAKEVDEAIEEFVGEDSFDAFEPADDSDDFFE